MKLKTLVFLILALIPGMISHSFGQSYPAAKGTGTINTVNGTISSKEIKLALTHEHIMSNFGSEINRTGDYDEAALFTQVVPYLIRSRWASKPFLIVLQTILEEEQTFCKKSLIQREFK